MYLLNGVPVSPDNAFESGGVAYPPGWIKSATPAEQAAAGITWQDDQPRPDDFYAYVYPDPAAPWQWLTTPYTADEMKPRLEQYSRQKREQRENAGVEQVIGPQTYTIPSDISTRRSFFDLRVIHERPAAPSARPCDFGSTVLMLSQPTLLAIEQKMEDRVLNCVTTQLNLQDGIQSGTVTTKEQIDTAYAAVP